MDNEIKEKKWNFPVPLDEFMAWLDRLFIRQPYIVRLAYKYKWQNEYEKSNEYLEWDWENDSYYWLNDWNEGHDEAYVLAFVAVADIFEGESDNAENNLCTDK